MQRKPEKFSGANEDSVAFLVVKMDGGKGVTEYLTCFVLGLLWYALF